MPINITQGTIYESFSMIHPDGTLMCHCNEKKANWYVNRKLAKWIDDKKFQLNFVPNGYGKSKNPYYVQSMENQCVVCGTKENLNKHHVVPYVFRSRFPVEMKESNHHDILPTCVDCHENYEGHATKFKEELANKIGLTMNISSMSDKQKNNRKILSARTLLKKIQNGELVDNNGKVINIPKERLTKLKAKAAEELSEEVPINGAIWADKIVENILENNQLFNFVKSWRRHFIQYANPKYLPNHWSIDSPLETSNRALKFKKEKIS